MIAADFVIIGVILLIAAIVSMVTVAAVTRVPYVPTPRIIADGMIALARLQGAEVVYDLGAGTGSIIRRAAEKYPQIHAVGIELSPPVWLAGWFLSRSRAVRFICKSVFAENLSEAEVIFLYMLPKMMERLEEKFDQELKPGTVVVSHAFPFARKKPAEEIRIAHGQRNVPLFRYVW